MGAAAMALMVGGSIINAVSQMEAGKARAAQDRVNSSLAISAAEDASARGGIAMGRARQKGSEIIGQARADAAAGNIDVQSGAVLDSIGKTRLMSEEDAQMLKVNSLREALGYRVRAGAFKAQASADEEAGTLGAIGSLLGGASSAVSGGYNAGLFPVASR